MGARSEEPDVAFARELSGWRSRRGMSQKRLARSMGFDPSYVSHVESGRHFPSEDFVQRAERVLGAGGQLWSVWRASSPRPGRRAPASPDTVVVELDRARLTYADGAYHAEQTRRILNAGSEPVTRYLMRISVDRYPGDPERSNRLYRERPLRWDELGLTAKCDGEPMLLTPKQDRDSFKEVWLCFENDRGRFPLYPGQRATLSYDYVVDDGRWGRWFQRAVRLPTEHLEVAVDFPRELDPVVWGTETSSTVSAAPFPTPPARTESGAGRIAYSWAIDDPPVGARYRLEWRFGDSSGVLGEPGDAIEGVPSARMAAVGIVQLGDPLLTRPARRLSLPEEDASARACVERLVAGMRRVREQHLFSKGSGLAAPQIGEGVAAVVVIPPDEVEPLVLLNPRVIDESAEHDSQYEGCLSFFDVRGMVPRPLWIEVEHCGADGSLLISRFERGLARLVLHEIDHLEGVVYTARMRSGVHPIPVAEYRGTGRPWTYA